MTDLTDEPILLIHISPPVTIYEVLSHPKKLIPYIYLFSTDLEHKQLKHRDINVFWNVTSCSSVYINILAEMAPSIFMVEQAPSNLKMWYATDSSTLNEGVRLIILGSLTQ
jgi:hypothetical protein